MSNRGAPRGRGGGFSGGRGAGGFASRGRGGFQPAYGPPAAVLEMGSFVHACEGDIICESINPKIPKFNSPVYLENKTAIGKIDEILGPINQVYFTIKPQDGIVATSFKSGDKFYIGGDRLLPLEMFLPKPKPPPGLYSLRKREQNSTDFQEGAAKLKRAGGASRGGPIRGGRGGSRGGSRGAPRGRGGFGDRGGRGGGRGGTRGGSGGRGGGFGSSRGGGRGGNPNFTRAGGSSRGRGS